MSERIHGDGTYNFCITPFTHMISNNNHAMFSKFEWGVGGEQKNGQKHTRLFDASLLIILVFHKLEISF